MSLLSLGLALELSESFPGFEEEAFELELPLDEESEEASFSLSCCEVLVIATGEALFP